MRLAETFTISRGSEDEAEVVQVELRHGDVLGFGEAAPIGHYDQSADSALAWLEQVDPGDDPFALDELFDGLPPGEDAARAALDHALHDLQGKLVGQPVYKLLGLRRGGPPTSWTIWLGDPDDMARRTERILGRGFKRLKLKLGGGDGLDAERVDAVRAVTELPLQCDVNEAWSLDEALDYLPRMTMLQYCEQPLRRRRPGRAGAEAPFADPDLRRRGLPRARRRRRLRRARARDQHQAREGGRDPRVGAHGARGAGARARRHARLHGRVGPRASRRARTSRA